MSGELSRISVQALKVRGGRTDVITQLIRECGYAQRHDKSIDACVLYPRIGSPAEASLDYLPKADEATVQGYIKKMREQLDEQASWVDLLKSIQARAGDAQDQNG